MGERLKTQGVGQVSFVVKSVDDLREFYHRLQQEEVRIARTITHGISLSIYFYDPEDNYVELYYKTGLQREAGLRGRCELG